MGNTFKSLVAAAGILAAGDATNAQEGAADSTANKTKQALVELLSELPPGFDSARKVIEGDITLAGDGDLSDSDKLAIEGHMGKLATVIPESARKVREAMTGVETIVAADQVAALNEGPEDKKIREAEERRQKMAENSAEGLMDSFLEDKNWGIVQGNTLETRIKRNGRGIEIIGNEKDTNPDHEAKIDLPALLSPGSYRITIGSSVGLPISLYLYDSGGKPIDMNGGIIQAGSKKSVAEFPSNTAVEILIPANCKKALFQGRITSQDRHLAIEAFVTEVLTGKEGFAQNK